MPQDEQQNVYIGYKDVIYKLNGHEGSVIWQSALSQPYEPNPFFGSSMKIAVMNEIVYILFEYSLYALYCSDGKEIWHYFHMHPHDQPDEGGQQLIKMFFDTNMLYVYTGEKVMSFDPENGSHKWEIPISPNGADIEASHGNLFIGEFFSEQSLSVLHAFDGVTGQERWRFEHGFWGGTSRCYVSQIGDIIYKSGNPLYALDARTGQKIWEQRVSNRAVEINASFVLNGVLYAQTHLSTFISEQDLQPEIFRIHTFDALTGEPRWQSEPGYSLSSAISNEDRIVVTGLALYQNQKGLPTLQALHMDTGELCWQFSLAESSQAFIPVFFPPQTQSVRLQLYLLDESHGPSLVAIDLLTGKQVAQHTVALPPLEGFRLCWLSKEFLYVRTSVHEGGSYVSGSRNTFCRYTIHAIRLTDGTTAWQYNTGSLLECQEPISMLQLAP